MKGEQGEKLIRQRVEQHERESHTAEIDTERLWGQLQQKQPQPGKTRSAWRTLWAAAILLVAAGVGTWQLMNRAEPDEIASAVMPINLSASNAHVGIMQTDIQDTNEDDEYAPDDIATAGMYAAPDELMAQDATADPQLIYN